MSAERPTRPDSRVWEAFAGRWQGHRFLEFDPLYSLPERFILYLNAEARDLIEYDDLNFEYDLSRTVNLGFFLRRPIGIVLRTDLETGEEVETAEEEGTFAHAPDDGTEPPQPLPAKPGPRWWDWDEGRGAARDNRNRIHQLSRKGMDKEEAERLVGDELTAAVALDRQQDEYLGWLIQQDQFWTDLRLVNDKCKAEVIERGGMPVLNPDSDVHSPDGLEYDDYYTPDGPEKEVYWVRWVCRKWCLAGLQAWHLFLPRRPQVATYDVRPLGVDQGLTISIPYPFLAGNQLDIRELVRRLRAEHTPAHLRGWVGVGGRVAVRSTKGSFRKAFQMYRLLVLCLMRRYPERLTGQTVRLVEVLANYFAGPKVAERLARGGQGENAEQTRQQRIALLGKLRSAAADFFPWLT